MTSKVEKRRREILDTANSLIYSKGYNQTSIADVASQVGITKGNLQYHYKSKELLLGAVIDLRLQGIKNNLVTWEEKFPDARDRLKRFATMLLNEKSQLIRYGCPMGTLNMELGKNQPELRKQSRSMFDEFLQWLTRQFECLDDPNPVLSARHLLCVAQGAALMSYVYQDAEWLEQEVDGIMRWLDTM